MRIFSYERDEEGSEYKSEVLRDAIWEHLPRPTKQKRRETHVHFNLSIPPIGQLFIEYAPDYEVYEANSLAIRHLEPYSVTPPEVENMIRNLVTGNPNHGRPNLPSGSFSRTALQTWCSLDADTGVIHDFEIVSGTPNTFDFIDASEEDAKNATTPEERLLAAIGLLHKAETIRSSIDPASLGQIMTLDERTNELATIFERI